MDADFDLDSLALGDVGQLELLGPNGEPLRVSTGCDLNGEATYAPVILHLLRLDSAEAQKHANRHRNQILRKAARSGQKKREIDIDEIDSNALELLVSCTKNWTNMRRGGKDVPCTPDNVRDLYKDHRFSWIRKQVDAYVTDPANYLGNS